jgi:hypothetical protein
MIPASLQALKDAARNVSQEAESVAEQESAAWWDALVTAAQKSLGPLWEFVTNKERQRQFSRQHARYEFLIEIPGHRQMVVIFHVLHSGYAFWARGKYSGSTADVEGGQALWMVSPRPINNHLPMYFQTLGAALVAAESR